MIYPAFQELCSIIAARKPLPLTTVELQKAGSRLLRLAPKKVLDVGFIFVPLFVFVISIHYIE